MSASLDLTLDRESDVPLGTQLAWKLRVLILAGVLVPGARLPGVREVAESAGVNVNTVRSVFARLEEQGLLNSEQGRGTFVAASARPDAALAEAAKTAIAGAREAGVDPRELAAALYVTRDMPRAAPERAELAEKRVLRSQIASLERHLSRLEPLATLTDAPATTAGRLLSSEELRTVRDQLAARIELLQREREEARAAAALDRATEAEEDQRVSKPARVSQWRNSGVWTGRPAAGISWTAS